MIYGIGGGVARGFTHEYPIERHIATILWEGLRILDPERREEFFRKSRILPEYQEELRILEEMSEPKDVHYKVEGDIMEVLALHDLERDYPPTQYFLTSGIAYHESPNSRTIGELDLVVGDRGSCEIVVVGEAKLGLKLLGKAKQQLSRFSGFLNQRLR